MSVSAREEAEAALKQAQRAAKRGDAREAERWSKTAERMAAAAAKLAETAPATPEDDEEFRQQLLTRIRALSADYDELNAWQQEYAIYAALKAQAEAHNIPPPEPIRPCPKGPEYLHRIHGYSGDA